MADPVLVERGPLSECIVMYAGMLSSSKFWVVTYNLLAAGSRCLICLSVWSVCWPLLGLLMHSGDFQGLITHLTGRLGGGGQQLTELA